MWISFLFIFLGWATLCHGVEITGGVVNQSSGPVDKARVTLFTSDLRFFREVRTSTNGSFSFPNIADGLYRVGVALVNHEYVERVLTVNGSNEFISFPLKAETNGGRWTIVGDTAPELLDGTGSGTLLPTGEILYCHDTEDPIVFDPVTRLKWFPPTSGSGQGCHIPTLNTDGSLFFAGGSEDGYPQGLVVKTVKQYWRTTNSWSRLPDMKIARWYPGIVRLPNERLMVLGGELNGTPNRTAACEIFDPITRQWTTAASFALPSEITPTVLLYNGEVFKTWRYPEIYNVASNTWRPAPPMIQARVGAAEGDHADHEMIFLPDGRVMTIGVGAKTKTSNTRFCEFYSPEDNKWTLGPNPQYLRQRPEAVMLPDGRVLAFGGEYTDIKQPPAVRNAGTILNCTKLTDVYDPALNSWRGLADMKRYIHYHNVTVLVPDGRVIASGGAGLTANRSFAGDDMSIEAFEPPYLFRGVRPEIKALSTTELRPGSAFTLDIQYTDTPSQVVLVSARAATHWVDGGPQRYLSLPFTQTNSILTATVPNDPVKALAGLYMVFVLVDDIPSPGKIVRLLPNFEVAMTTPSIDIQAIDGVLSETGGVSGFRFTRTGDTTSPLRVDIALSGSALNGMDYQTLSNSIVIPTGQTSALLAVRSVQDILSEGLENLGISIQPSIGYTLTSNNMANLVINDDEMNPSSPMLSISKVNPDSVDLTYSGPASRSVTFLQSRDLLGWEEFALGVAEGSQVRLRSPQSGSARFYKAIVR